MYAWIENNNIFISNDISLIPNNVNYIEIPDNILLHDLKIVDNKILFKSEEDKVNELREKIKENALIIYENVIREKLRKFGFNNLGDIKIYADLGNKDAQDILNWYLQFDNKFWNWIENELLQKTYRELLDLDLHELINSFQ